jgi:hypothetical protein
MGEEALGSEAGIRRKTETEKTPVLGEEGNA